MKISKIFFLFVLLCSFLQFTSCEKNDLCGGLDAKTPLVNIEFYNSASSTELKNIAFLRCYSEEQISNDTILVKEFTNTSQISLPLKVTEGTTNWVFDYYEVVDNEQILIGSDVIRFRYIPQSEYTSKACGYRTFFTDVTTQLNNNTSSNQRGNWIIAQESVNQIINENEAHVSIFF